MATQNYAVTGMSCEHCEHAITEEIQAIAGVSGIEVDARTGRLAVTAAAPIEDAVVLSAVEEAGYRAVRA